MFKNKYHKAITFSFDDGVRQDIRLIKLFDKYHLKCTFNLNSLSLDKEGVIFYNGKYARHDKINSKDVKEIYKNHEVAVHTLHHPDLTKIEDEKEIIHEINEDKKILESLVGYEIVGMAYPFGTVNERIINIIKNNTEIKYSRNIFATYEFKKQDELLSFRPTVHCLDFKKMYELADKFLSLKTDEDAIFYIWGHAYEFDFDDTWMEFEKFLKYISNKEDIFYGTNKEVLLNE